MSEELPPIEVNGRQYPLWSQFVHKKAEWIGGILESFEMGRKLVTEITDIRLEPNGTDSAMFEVCGKDFGCAFDVGYGGIGGGEKGWMTFSTRFGHTWRIKKP